MSNTPQTKKGLGTFDFFCVGFGAIVGVGWAVSLNKWMASAGGPVPAALGYLITLVLMVPVGLCFAELVPMLPVAGGTTAFTYRAFGEKASYVAGWLTLGAFLTLMPWEAIYVVDIASILFPALKAGAPLYVLAGSDIYLGHIVVGTIIALFFFYINYKGADLAAGLQKVLCIFLIGVGVLSMVCGLVKFDVNNLMPVYENIGTSAHNSMFGGMFAILATSPFFLCGFENIPQTVEDAGGSHKKVGFTVLLSIIMACLFYALLLFCIGVAWPWQDFYLNTESPAAANVFAKIFAGSAMGNVMYILLCAGALCGLLTTWNSFFMGTANLMMALARTHMLPFALSKRSAKTGTPVNALIVCLVASIVGPFLGLGLIDPLTTFSAAAYVVSWGLAAFCLIKLRKTEPSLPRPYKIPGGLPMAWFAALSMVAILIMMFIPGTPAYIGGMAVKMFLAWCVVGVAMFLATAPSRNQKSPEERYNNLFANAAQQHQKDLMMD